jgi:hypothetical protein
LPAEAHDRAGGTQIRKEKTIKTLIVKLVLGAALLLSFTVAALSQAQTETAPGKAVDPVKAIKKDLAEKEREKLQGGWQIVKVTIGGHEDKTTPVGLAKSMLVLGADGWGVQVITAGKVTGVGSFALDPDPASSKLPTLTLNVKALGFSGDMVATYLRSGDDLYLAFNICLPNEPPANFSGSGAADWVWHLKRVKN